MAPCGVFETLIIIRYIFVKESRGFAYYVIKSDIRKASLLRNRAKSVFLHAYCTSKFYDFYVFLSHSALNEGHDIRHFQFNLDTIHLVVSSCCSSSSSLCG